MSSEHPAIAARRSFIERFAAICAGDARIAAVFLSGSYARGTPDPFSDVDLCVVVAEGAYESLFEDRWRILERLGDLVLAEDFDGFGRDMLLFLYANGVDGEVDLYRRHAVSWAHPEELVPLVDRHGVAAEVRAWPRADPAERRRRVERLFRWFWRHVWLGAAAVARGRLLSAHHALEAARVTAVNLARLRHDLEAAFAWSGCDKADDALTREEQSALARSFGPLDSASLSRSLHALVEFFEPLARELAHREGLREPQELARVVRSRLDALRPGSAR